MGSSKINATSNSISESERKMSSNENNGYSPQRGFGTISQIPKKKILAERNSYNDAPLESETIPIVKPIICSSEYIPLSLRVRSSDPTPYDPVNNFTSPRPMFLRYNPNRRIEILHRMDRENTTTDGEGSSSSSAEQGEEVGGEASLESFASSDQEKFQQAEEEGSDAEVDDAREEEERRWCWRMVWKSLFLIGLFLLSRHYLFPMTSSSPPLQDNGGSSSSSREIIILQGPRNLLIAHMGLSDMCFDVEGLMCAIDEEDRSSFLVFDESSEEEAHDGILAIGEQVVNTDLVMSDEVTGEMLNSEEEDLYYGIEERDEEKLAEAEESADLTGSVPAPLSAIAPFPLVDDHGADLIFESARRLAILVSRPRPLCCVPMNLLAAALVVVSVCIFRHVLNRKASSSSPKRLLPRSKSLGKKRFNASFMVGSDEKRFKSAVIEEFGDEGKDSRLRPLPSNPLPYATRPPTVQLLGEFSFAEPTVSKSGAGQSSKGTDRPEESQLPQYQSKKRYEDSQIYMRPARKNVSCSASKVHPSTTSTAVESHTTLVKLPRAEDSGTRRKVKILATPLRRSDRLRKQLTSP